MEERNKSSLEERLGYSLPHDTRFTFYHISTPPTKCAALFSAPPGTKAEKTYCESHFLNVSIRPSDSPDSAYILVLAIEVLIYSTKNLTTLFVSKADSTGYLSLLSIPKGQPSPLRTITSTFVSYLVENRQRPNCKLVVSLFARASDQYLFPGSVENEAKHVSDDRQLIKWWCRVLDPVLRGFTPEKDRVAASSEEQKDGAATTAQAYLIVPGEDSMLSFLPQDVRLNPSLRKRWKHGHPLRDITSVPSAPPRCLIPHFPDDPKNRYLDELDDEIPDAQLNAVTDSPSKRGTGKWRSVQTLEQFWEMMAFRQECSSGRLVGFIWVVFTPPDYLPPSQDSQMDSQSSISTLHLSSVLSPPSSPSIKTKKTTSLRKPSTQRRKRLTGPIISRMPRIKSTSSNLSALVSNQPAESKYYTWPTTSRGTIVLDEKKYKKATELLLRIDFSNRGIAEASSRTWVDEVAVLGGHDGEMNWGREVEGKKMVEMKIEQAVNGNGNASGATPTPTMNTLQIKRKAPSNSTSTSDIPSAASSDSSLNLNSLKSETSINGTGDNGINTLKPRKRAKLISLS